jgi:hypothetical protein
MVVVIIIVNMFVVNNEDSSIGTATDYELDDRSSILGSIRLFCTPSRPILGPTQPPNQWVSGALSAWVKRKWREANHSPPSSTEVKNGGAIPPLPHISS